MLDVVFVTVSILFFAVSVGYVALCNRLAPVAPRAPRDEVNPS